MNLWSYIPIQRPQKKKKKGTNKQTKAICYLQYIHRVQGGTSKYHAFKIEVQKNNYTFIFIHASKTVCLNTILVQHSIPTDDTV